MGASCERSVCALSAGHRKWTVKIQAVYRGRRERRELQRRQGAARRIQRFRRAQAMRNFFARPSAARSVPACPVSSD